VKTAHDMCRASILGIFSAIHDVLSVTTRSRLSVIEGDRAKFYELSTSQRVLDLFLLVLSCPLLPRSLIHSGEPPGPKVLKLVGDFLMFTVPMAAFLFHL